MSHSIFWVSLLTLISGCASIVNGQNQSLTVTTPGCAGATCELTNDKGKWFISSTPGSVTVHRSYADLFVKCIKGGSPPVTKSIPSKTKGMAFGNILLGGIIGAGIDVANGAAYDYPNEISLPSSCTPPVPAAVSVPAPIRLGCTVKELVPSEDGVIGLPDKTSGVLVTFVMEASLAEKSGVRTGDVLLEFNGEPITGIKMLTESLSRQDPHHPFHIRYFRQGQYGSAEFNSIGGNL